MTVKKEEEKMLELVAIRKLRTMPLIEWEKDFIGNIESQTAAKGKSLTEKQKVWLKRLKEKYLQK